ncbi:dihydrofolate reductase-like domain-containing protein [Aspergillus avenaceus]|uniref:Dihydrofolate reductase n=1 Tax=Aspergillus avenaceus TaxID=36643 RepID=A0A5N6TGY7_ASPAV|nr:dihydrofolate reductase-like domain-containing protein [Aspergillus avenaceus]
MKPTNNPLTLIVATTPIPRNDKLVLGIGLNGTLPWPRIKADMSFFARVTSRAPRPDTHNAIIMGRKTYDSVPAHLRPLGKRVNVIVTRDASGDVSRTVMGELEAKKAKTGGEPTQPVTDAIVGGGLEEALAGVEGKYGADLGRVYVIGGAEIYRGALGVRGRKVRIVMTNVEKKEGLFECDTFFPVDEELVQEKGWRRVSDQEVTEWVGEDVSSEWKEEGDVRIQMVGYERTG